MKVKALIAELEKLDPDLTVVASSFDILGKETDYILEEVSEQVLPSPNRNAKETKKIAYLEFDKLLWEDNI